MGVRIALAGDTMLGRGVGALLSEDPDRQLVEPAVADAANAADHFICNLECCISDRGTRWPDPRKPFFFRAPPSAATTLARLGVDAVTLANNHALDFGPDALLDTLALLDEAGVAHAGAGPDEAAARQPAVLEHAGLRTALVSVTDHPAEFAAGPDQPGTAFAPLQVATPPWLSRAVAQASADVVLISPHWGPNMVDAPVPHVRESAAVLAEAGATLIAGHSAHVFHGVEVVGLCTVLYDLGDFVDDYATDSALRNDHGLLWFIDIEDERAVAVEALPLVIDYGHTRAALGAERQWIAGRLRKAVRSLPVVDLGDLLRIDLVPDGA